MGAWRRLGYARYLNGLRAEYCNFWLWRASHRLAQGLKSIVRIVTRRARSFSRRSYRHSNVDRGHEFARQHIEEAKAFSREIGGTDEDVKKYFFSLPERDLQIVLDLYEHHYGSQARAYADKTMDSWRTGRVYMGGQTATRLFNLLPPVMPLKIKYQLIANLWTHFGPSSKRKLRIGLDVNIEEVISAIREHIEVVVVGYRIPENLEKRFEWLAAGDTHVKQDLLNQLRHMEKALVVEGAKIQLPVMLDHLRSETGHNTYRLAQVLQIGRHELELSLEKHFQGVQLVEPSIYKTAAQNVGSSGDWKWLWWLIGIALLLFLMIRK